MSKAVKCDRCKGYFDPLEVGEKRFVLIEGVVYYDAESIKKQETIFRQRYIDLCPGCTSEFDLFMGCCKPDLAEITDPLVRKDGV